MNAANIEKDRDLQTWEHENITVVSQLDHVSVPLLINVDVSDSMQRRGTEFTCTCFLCKS